jgi:hypothetical protein
MMSKRDYLNEFAEGAMVLEPGRFDEAVVGVVSRIDRDPVGVLQRIKNY